MNLRDYVLGRQVVLQSPLSKSEVEKRINAAAGSSFSPFNRGVTGGVYVGRVRLAWSIPLFTNGFRPVFRGRVADVGKKSELKAIYGATTFLRIFYAFWYLFLTVFTVGGIFTFLNSESTSNEFFAIFPIIVPAFFAVPVIFHFVFNMNAEAHFEAILEFLKREAELN